MKDYYYCVPFMVENFTSKTWNIYFNYNEFYSDKVNKLTYLFRLFSTIEEYIFRVSTMSLFTFEANKKYNNYENRALDDYLNSCDKSVFNRIALSLNVKKYNLDFCLIVLRSLWKYRKDNPGIYNLRDNCLKIVRKTKQCENQRMCGLLYG